MSRNNPGKVITAPPVTRNPLTDDCVRQDQYDKDVESMMDAVIFHVERNGLVAKKQTAIIHANMFKELCLLNGNSLEVCNEIKEDFVKKTCEGESSLLGCAADSSDGGN